MQSPVNVLLTGATGYIGGAVLASLLEHPSAAQFAITAIVRSPEKAARLEALKIPNLRTVLGSHSDPAVVVPLAEQADIVVAAADMLDGAATAAVLEGLKKRHEKTGKVPVYIHTGGAGIVAHHNTGLPPDHAAYSDSDAAGVAKIASSPMYPIAIGPLLAADAAGFAHAALVLPPLIYGRARTALTRAGVANDRSQQVPGLVATGVARGQAPVVGRGLSVWPNIHIDELAALYVRIVDAAVAGTLRGHGADGYYFAASDEHKWYDLSKAVGDALFASGIAKTAEPSPFTDAEYATFFDGLASSRGMTGKALAEFGWGSNVHVRADRARTVGWTPTHKTADLLSSVQEELDAFLADQKAQAAS